MEIKSESTIEFTVTFKVSEEEARALHSLTIYGTNAFLEMYYKTLGKSYLQKHEKGLISCFDKLKKIMPNHFTRFDETRKAFK